MKMLKRVSSITFPHLLTSVHFPLLCTFSTSNHNFHNLWYLLLPFYFFLFFTIKMKHEKCVAKRLRMPLNFVKVIAFVKTPLSAHNFSIRTLFAYIASSALLLISISNHVLVMIRSNNFRFFQRKATSNLTSNRSLASHSLLRVALENFPLFHFALKNWSPVGKCSSLKVVASNCYGCESESVQKKEKKIYQREIVRFLFSN